MKSLFIVVALLATGSPALAWNPITGSRPVWCEFPVAYSMNSAGSADLGASASEVERAMNDWTTQSCTSLTAAYAGTTSRRPGDYEGTSTIGWTESGWPHGSGAIGVTAPAWGGGGGCIFEADMDLNGDDYTWTTMSGSGGRVNAFSIIAHEGGHFYGLGHSNDSDAIMYFAYSGGISSLNSDDVTGICTLYPGDGMPPPDCRTTGCPTGQECSGGRCVPITGDGTMCSVCDSHYDCVGAQDYCIEYPDGLGHCATGCNSTSDCPTGNDVCYDVGIGIGQCIRVGGSGEPNCGATGPTGCRSNSDCASTERCDTATGDCVPRAMGRGNLGDPCADDAGCNSNLCLALPGGSVCSESCNWLDPDASCPTGFYCDGTAVGQCGEGVCRRGGRGVATLGQGCGEHTDCASLYCSVGVCAEPCIPGGAARCPDGTSCQVGSTPGCGGCRTSSCIGGTCDSNDDCVSRICAVSGARTFCTQLCDDAADCPMGFTCDAAGSVRVCNPPLDFAGCGGPVGRDGGPIGDGGSDGGPVGRGGSRGGCCSVASADNPTLGLLAFLAMTALVLARRRKTS